MKDSEASEIPTNPAALRSSKRSRAAEDHNLSEKVLPRSKLDF